jgi:hypothetical protein
MTTGGSVLYLSAPAQLRVILPASPIPTLNTLTLALLALVLGGAAVLVQRRHSA